MYPQIRHYSTPRKLLPQVRRLLGLCSLEAWLQSPTRLRLICTPSAVSSALRKKETKFWFKCFILIFSAKTIQTNSLANMILPIANFSFAKRDVCFLYLRFFISTYEQHQRLQPLAGLWWHPNKLQSQSFCFQIKIALSFCCSFYDLFVPKHVVTSEIFVTNEGTGDLDAGINNSSCISRNPPISHKIRVFSIRVF